jgi:hypothetical protein
MASNTPDGSRPARSTRERAVLMAALDKIWHQLDPDVIVDGVGLAVRVPGAQLHYIVSMDEPTTVHCSALTDASAAEVTPMYSRHLVELDTPDDASELTP